MGSAFTRTRDGMTLFRPHLWSVGFHFLVPLLSGAEPSQLSSCCWFLQVAGVNARSPFSCKEIENNESIGLISRFSTVMAGKPGSEVLLVSLGARPLSLVAAFQKRGRP